ncbi:hypothetical protein CYMTET_18982 [Cymbomonas tetramitiformis]|uniref:Peptidase S54 rhomboid domain-containing protein n=1 Tax=Cymbomonas tetramitiformis TaxID=36881 RepID=A0AAE0G6X6_9CHLO|nr:hypothetical protein CYMTET_18982 [Cymbomonas tetramitiformis]
MPLRERRETQQQRELDEIRSRRADEWRREQRASPSSGSGGAGPRDALKKVVAWIYNKKWRILATAGCVAAFVLRPGEDSFRKYLKAREGLGGAARNLLEDTLFNLIGLKGTLRVTSYGLFSIAQQGECEAQHPLSAIREAGRWPYPGLVMSGGQPGGGEKYYIGALGAWLPLPCAKLMSARTISGSAEQDLELLVGANIAVWLAWQLCPNVFMTRHFTVDPANAQDRPYTLLTAAFSHKSAQHLISNMHSLLAVAPLLQRALGRSRFNLLFLGGGACSSLVSAACNQAMGRVVHSLGASGGVLALLACNARLFPDQQYLWWGDIQLDAPKFLCATLCLDIFRNVLTSETHKVDVWGHLGGALFGLCFCVYLQRPV